jgi:hypothetical protein
MHSSFVGDTVSESRFFKSRAGNFHR